MSIKCSFMDNQVYGAEDINLIFSKLTTQGVSLFAYDDGDNPLLSLNQAVSSFVNPGIEMYNNDSCKVIYDNENSAFKIMCGSAFMNDGSSIAINSEPYDITNLVSELRETCSGNIYVFFKRNTTQNSIDILVSDSQEDATGELCVPLAYISSDNTVADLRKIAVSKIAPCTGNIIKDVTFTSSYINPSHEGMERLRGTIPNVFPGATRVCVVQYIDGQIYRVAFLNIQNVAGDDEEEIEYTLFDSHDNLYFAFNRVGTDLQIWMKSISTGAFTTEYSITIY